MADIGYAQAIVMTLLDGLDRCYRTVVADNFFTSISLAKRFCWNMIRILLGQ